MTSPAINQSFFVNSHSCWAMLNVPSSEMFQRQSSPLGLLLLRVHQHSSLLGQSKRNILLVSFSFGLTNNIWLVTKIGSSWLSLFMNCLLHELIFRASFQIQESNYMGSYERLHWTITYVNDCLVSTHGFSYQNSAKPTSFQLFLAVAFWAQTPDAVLLAYSHSSPNGLPQF